ncbi:hypothetical protein MSZK_54690 [Mycobacterium sp. shizuoka-1]|nr:hypothetical protein MSZK_54690 [Mycobacterium sp. shizuoka-1]
MLLASVTVSLHPPGGSDVLGVVVLAGSSASTFVGGSRCEPDAGPLDHLVSFELSEDRRGGEHGLARHSFGVRFG